MSAVGVCLCGATFSLRAPAHTWCSPGCSRRFRVRRQHTICTHPGCCNFLGRHQGKYCGPEHKTEGKNAVQRLWSKTRPEAPRRAA